MKPIIVAGPTASGKTSLGITLAKRFGGAVISADSRMVYRQLDIGTGKPTWEKLPVDVRPLLQEAARKACRRLSEFSRQSEARDIEVLQKHGVQVVAVDNAVLDQWRQLIDGVLPQVRGSFLPAESLDAALKRRDQCRRQAGKAGGS